jgi:hypothetical protein
MIRVSLHTESDTPVAARLGYASRVYATLNIGDATLFFNDPALLQEVADAAHAAATALRVAVDSPATDGDVWPTPTEDVA